MKRPSSKRTFNRLIVSALLALAATLPTFESAGAKALYSYFLFFPNRDISRRPEELSGVAREDVTIPLKKGSLKGWFFHKPDSPYVVLVSHGNGGNVSHMIWQSTNLLDAGPSVLAYDYRGYGDSPGNPSVKNICADGDAAYKFLVEEKHYEPDHIILYGQSLGCAVACHIAQANKVGAIILQSGFSSLRTVAIEHYPSLKHATILVPNVLDNSSILSKLTTPLLIMHGDADKMVPFDNAEKLYAAAAGPKKLEVFHDAGHNLNEAKDHHKEVVSAFITDFIKSNEKKSDTVLSKEPAPVANPQ